MRRLLISFLFSALAMLSGSSFAAGATFGQIPPDSVIVHRAGLDWIWAAPCSPAAGSCGQPTEMFGFHIPTTTEWLDSFLSRADLIAAFSVGNCGSPWMSPFHSHCDFNDLSNGHIYQAATFCDPNYYNGCLAGTTETFFVRQGNGVPEPTAISLILAALGMAGFMSRRRRDSRES